MKKFKINDPVWVYEIGQSPQPAIVTDLNPFGDNTADIIRCHLTESNIAPDRVRNARNVFHRPDGAETLYGKILQDAYDCRDIAMNFAKENNI